MRTKIIQGKNYGSIPHLSNSKVGEHDKYLTSGQEAIILNGGRDKHDRLTVTLKLDGTNVGITKKDGNLVTLQRKGFDCASSPYRQHHEFDKWVHENHERFDDLLHEGDRIVGEWMWQASGIEYEIWGGPFFAFDYFPYFGGRMSYDAMVEHIAGYEIKMPTAIWDSARQEVPKSFPLIKRKFDLLHEIGAIMNPNPGKVDHEGMVFRVERKGKFDFMAKWVRPDFEPGKFLPGIGLPVGAEPVQNIIR